MPGKLQTYKTNYKLQRFMKKVTVVLFCSTGSSRYKVWEAIQASAAAPGYFQECRIGDMLHQVSWGAGRGWRRNRSSVPKSPFSVDVRVENSSPDKIAGEKILDQNVSY